MRSLAACFFVLSALPATAAQGPDPAVDDFERHLLGPNWTTFGSSPGIVDQSDIGVLDTSWLAVAWNASTFTADQFCEAQISPDIEPGMLTQVYVRRRASDNARYGFHWNGDPGNSRWEIKYDGVPTAQTRILASVDGPGPVPGDVLRIEASGSDPVVLQTFHNGVLLLSATDSAPQRIVGSAQMGMVARMAQGQSNDPPTPIFEGWSGGSSTEPSVGAVFCSGDGSGASCPCGNAGAGRHGCENSFATGGAFLFATGAGSVSADTVTLSVFALPPDVSLLFFQGDAQVAGGGGARFGDGLRCAGGSVVRLGTRSASGGTAAFGFDIPSDPTVSAAGMVPASGGVRHYQVWYRNAAAYCTPATFNLSNGLSITWGA